MKEMEGVEQGDSEKINELQNQMKERESSVLQCTYKLLLILLICMIHQGNDKRRYTWYR